MSDASTMATVMAHTGSMAEPTTATGSQLAATLDAEFDVGGVGRGRRLTISAMIDSATSSAVLAPMSSPAGVDTRDVSDEHIPSDSSTA